VLALIWRFDGDCFCVLRGIGIANTRQPFDATIAMMGALSAAGNVWPRCDNLG
jgi:hypothetical protein